MRGRALKLSMPRRLVGDLMRFSIGVPRVTVQRQMNLGPLVAPEWRSRRPSWTAIFLKGYALLARETPELRRAYVKLPWPQLYEYPVSVASIAHEREYDGERAVLLSSIRAPTLFHRGPGHSITRRAVASGPEVKEFRRALKLARAPAPLRWLLMWLGLNIGRQRANYLRHIPVVRLFGPRGGIAQPAYAIDHAAQLRPDQRGRIGECPHPLRPPGHGWSERRASAGENFGRF